MRNIFFFTIFLIALASCKEAKQVIYLKEAETLPIELLQQKSEPANVKIAIGDELSLKIESDDQESVAMFNRDVLVSSENQLSTTKNVSDVSYKVDINGNISLPIIGKVSVVGLTIYEAEQLIASLIYPQYVKKEPVVTIGISNFKITILGDVNSPGVIDIEKDKVNILEALAMAGDLNITGRRNNVMLIRTQDDGSREIYRYDLNDKYLLFSPYFNLKQNDMIYVEQNRSKTRNAFTLPTVVTFSLSMVSTVVSIATLVRTYTR
ncbi:MAG: polysaccharide biosynthesis/export family protein [Muribaculaceae bacterium]|nr:polysaccharide biosynthesis/export family protein [Muribaculaceae bacterium]